MKSAVDAILRLAQAAYLEPLHSTAMCALAAIAGTTPQEQGRDPLLAKMEARAAERGYPISDPEVALLLSVLGRLSAPQFVVELGTNIGYGAIVLARSAGPAARVVTIESRADLVVEARGFIAEAGLSERINVRHGSAIAELEKIEEPIDLIYVDCVKEEYGRYLEIAVPKLSARGVLVADNVLWKGLLAEASPPSREAERVGALRQFNRALVTHRQLCSVILPLGDGVALAAKI